MYISQKHNICCISLKLQNQNQTKSVEERTVSLAMSAVESTVKRRAKEEEQEKEGHGQKGSKKPCKLQQPNQMSRPDVHILLHVWSAQVTNQVHR